MKFPVGICILMGFWLNACTTEGEGNEFITKLASREEANEIMDYVNRQAFAFNQLENAAKPHALPTSKKLKLNDLLLVDAGIK